MKKFECQFHEIKIRAEKSGKLRMPLRFLQKFEQNRSQKHSMFPKLKLVALAAVDQFYEQMETSTHLLVHIGTVK
jgi:hypothetical protein